MSTNRMKQGNRINNLDGQIIRPRRCIHTVAKAAFSPRGLEGQGIEDPIIVNKRPSLAEKLELAGAGCGTCACHGGEPPAAKVAGEIQAAGRHPLGRVNPKIPKNKTPDPVRLVLKIDGSTAIVTASGPRGQAIIEMLRRHFRQPARGKRP